MEPYFSSGNIESIANSTIASASIPTVVPPQIIDGEYYVDGGVGGAPPLTIMQESILHLSKKKSLHLIYINSFDLDCQINEICLE